MFVRLGRYLRAAGYDTAIAEDRSDDERLVEQAEREGRVLLTGDRRLGAAHSSGSPRVVVLPSTLREAATELGRCFALDWLSRAFSRCLLCNVALERAPDEAWAQVPALSRRPGAALRRCPVCGRLYWEGSHARRMRARLQSWQEGS